MKVTTKRSEYLSQEIVLVQRRNIAKEPVHYDNVNVDDNVIGEIYTQLFVRWECKGKQINNTNNYGELFRLQRISKTRKHSLKNTLRIQALTTNARLSSTSVKCIGF